MQQFHQMDVGEPTSASLPSKSRRTLIKGAVAGAVGAAGLGGTAMAALPMLNAHAAPTNHADCLTSIQDIFTIARTAERLAVTFYTNGIKNADKLGIQGAKLDVLKAALVEEQIHELYFAAAGGKALASTFSFPHGSTTFENLSAFIATQQQLEGVFDSAFLSAIREFCAHGRSDLAQIAGQIATVEAEHRALGRFIGGLEPADDWAFSPVLIAKVGDAPALVKKAGYLSPKNGNSYEYHQASTEDQGVVYRKPFAVSCS
ncbi:ferritin-like domain-containing protein [Ktedonosporobacter rubrisoli]|uniref:Ferritin-like domain-containing protein n=1 Tax=Ktedonosporobacter rubrisoli TaxID=2509675 RepID=A0A4P6JI49_KTERU|nr:ferritin-like domain-containing protein [Ktedonosporobacter rubrisoli]QBD74582.1 ferritin-like domain-containing protein [Ktedonosporobacter rubrisoli]